jgi:hypothetical protein
MMKLEEITTAVVEETLSAWRHAHQGPATLLQLVALRETVNHAGERLALRDFIVSLVETQLWQQRLLAGIPQEPLQNSREAVATAVNTDFRQSQRELADWSALYFRYLSPIALTVAELATASSLSTRQFRRHVSQGTEQLTDLIRQQEAAAQKRQHGWRLQRFLPPPDFAQLFGMEEVVADITSRLTREDGPRFVSVEGLGGIGKTAVAQTTAYQLADRANWQEILWISARQERLTTGWQFEKIEDPIHSLEDVITRLAHQLGQENLAGLPTIDKLNNLKPILLADPHLIIIDNLETLSDTQALLPALFPLAGPTRFLLTSRYSLRDVGFVHVLPLSELSLAASQALLESELARHGQAATLPLPAMAAIYQTLGGLPLALKLVAAQLGDLPLEHVLEGLKVARRQGPERMYDFIYGRTWHLLPDTARHLLLTMLLVSPDGEDVSWLKLMSNLDTADFDDALMQLRRYSLLETAGSLAAPRYRLHRLTTTFLKTEVLLQWQEESLSNRSYLQCVYER